MVTAALIFIALALLFPGLMRVLVLCLGIAFVAGYSAYEEAVERPTITSARR